MKKNLEAKTMVFPFLTPVFVVATYDEKGSPNAMTAAWGGICCSEPPCVTVSLRKATYTYNSLMEKKAYTLNIPGKAYAKEADYFGIASARDEDKFAVTGLTPVKAEFVDAPYIEEFAVNLECKIVHIADLGLHTQFVGEVLAVKVDASIAENEKQPIIEQIMPLLFSPNSRGYYIPGDTLGRAFSIGKGLKE